MEVAVSSSSCIHRVSEFAGKTKASLVGAMVPGIAANVRYDLKVSIVAQFLSQKLYGLLSRRQWIPNFPRIEIDSGSSHVAQ